MFKQKFIPLTSMAILLFSCGGGAIKVNELVTDEDGGEVGIISKKIDIKANTTYSFDIDYGAFKAGFIEETGSGNMFCFCNKDHTEVFDLLDVNSIKITYNDKELTKFDGTYEEWIEAEEDETEYKYAYGNETQITESGEAMVLSFKVDSDVGKKSTDSIKISLKALSSKNDVYAFVMPFTTH